MKTWIAPSFLLFWITAIGAAPSAWSHAILVSSSPRDNSVLKSSPSQAALRFNSRIEKKVTQVTLLDSKGKKIELPASPDGYTAGAPDALLIPLPSLRPGEYRLQFRVLAVDGHTTPGMIRFSVKGAGAS